MPVTFLRCLTTFNQKASEDKLLVSRMSRAVLSPDRVEDDPALPDIEAVLTFRNCLQHRPVSNRRRRRRSGQTASAGKIPDEDAIAQYGTMTSRMDRERMFDLGDFSSVCRTLPMPKPRYERGRSGIPRGSENTPNSHTMLRGGGRGIRRSTSVPAPTSSPLDDPSE
jgi:hypothetical protein